MVPLTGFTAGKLFGLRRKLVGFADKRVNLISELVNGIRVIKFYAWETAFSKRVAEIRDAEVATIWTVSKISATFGVLLFAAPVLIGVAAIGTFSLAGDAPLTSSRVYTISKGARMPRITMRSLKMRPVAPSM
jgi:ATP-binding cassette subfamily C (CFTR/MRP) protein 1